MKIYNKNQKLTERRNIWNAKPLLRLIYSDMFQRISKEIKPGLTLEIGCGSGISKDFIGSIISTDILAAPWVDVAADCQALPFSDNSLDNVILVDVLHHIELPVVFIREALRVIKPKGRLVMIEPAMTPFSILFYKYIHEEPVDMSINPFELEKQTGERDPFDANQAIPTLMFGRYRNRFKQDFPDLTICKKSYMSLWSYPLSGGFKSWSLIPLSMATQLLRLEKTLEKFVGWALGFRLIIVLEKNTKP